MVRHTLMAAILLASSPGASAQGAWLTLGEAAYQHLKQGGHQLTLRANRQAEAGENIYVLQVKASHLPRISGTLHAKLRHCGGFMYHASEQAALAALNTARPTLPLTRPSYALSNQALVVPMLAQMDAANIEAVRAKVHALTSRFPVYR